MSENNKSKENQKRQFDEDQYQMLLRCSEKKDMTEWKEWREANEETPILLEGANLKGANLHGFNLEGADLAEAHLEGAKLIQAHLEGAIFRKAHLEGADLDLTHLEGANFFQAHLEGAKLIQAHLEGAEFRGAHLEGADFTAVAVDGKTIFWNCFDSAETDFTGTGLDSARVEPVFKEKIKGNVRRIQWRRWCENQSFLRGKMVLIFWDISDYGRSTMQIVKWFGTWAFTYAFIYLSCGLISPPGIINNLMDVSPQLSALRSIYFSVVTMTTLGFGDIYAQSGSFWGYILLTFQVLMGYILLGALIVRFGILFTSSGPSSSPTMEIVKPEGMDKDRSFELSEKQ